MDQAEFDELQATAIRALKSGDQDANQRLAPMLDDSESIFKFRFLLDNSQDQYALYFAAKGIEQLILKFWTKYEKGLKIDLRVYMLTYLSTKGEPIIKAFPLKNFGKTIVDTVCTIVAKLTKFGWFEDDCYKSIVTDAKSLLGASNGTLYYIGLRILNSVGDSMSCHSGNQTMTSHRKIAVSFRDTALLEAFVIGVNCLKEINSGALPMEQAEQTLNNDAALELTLCSLSFDFIGNHQEEGEDVNTVQVPSSWKPYIQDSWLLNFMYEYYISSGAGYDPDSSPPDVGQRLKQILECVVQLASVRRTLFETDDMRHKFLQNILKGVLDILRGGTGLTDENCHHQFCRLIGRLRANYSLADLIRIPETCLFMEEVCKFTVATVKQLSLYMNGSQYLLAMWKRLVELKSNIPSNMLLDVACKKCMDTLQLCVSEIVGAYLEIAIQCAYTVAEDTEDDLLSGETEGTIRDQMDKFAGMACLQYGPTSEKIYQLYEENIHAYANPSLPTQELLFVESKLAWLTNLVSSMINSSSSAAVALGAISHEHLTYDGPLCSRVFHMIEIAGSRYPSGHSQYIPLEKAVLFFLRIFRKVYMLEGAPMTTITTSYSGASAAMPLLAAVLASQSSSKAAEEDRTIFTAMNIGDLHNIMNRVILKLCSNINGFTTASSTETNEVLDETLEVFIELITNYASSKMLLDLESVQRIISNHTGDMFPFLGYNNNNKHRIKFYAALMRLVFTSSEDINNSFDGFILPNLGMLDQLNSLPSFNVQDQSIKWAIVGVLRDFRGIAEATYTKRTYNLLFDALYPNYFPLFLKIAQEYALDSEVNTALLKFMMEFAQNKGNNRIIFELSSPNGILLFQQTSQIVCIISRQVMQAHDSTFPLQAKYKCMRLLLTLFVNSLSGNYVNFGVFSLYKDPCLQDAMQIALQICLGLPCDENGIAESPKLSKAYFSFVEVLFRSHLDVVCQSLDSNSFISLLVNNLFGLDSLDTVVAGLCAQTFDHLTTYIFLNRTKTDKPTMQRIAEHIGTNPDILNDYMSKLFEVLILNTTSLSAYTITRPILSLLLANEASFHHAKQSLIQAQISGENQATLDAEFNKLLEDIHQSLEQSNRDKFTAKLTSFKNSVREFVTF